jgi:glutaconate CoA-transferase subunit A
MDLISRGKGPLFKAGDPFAFRKQRREFNTGRRSKVASVPEAVRRFVHDRDYLASGGFGTNRIATALLHELLRQKKKGFMFAGHTSTHDYEILVAGNCLRQVDAAYVVGLEARGLSVNARRAHQEGSIETCEWSNASLAWRLAAGARGIPFYPTYVNAGTDTYTFSAAVTVECPFTRKPVILVPALNPDVALIHVHRADEIGNCEIRGNTVADLDLACASVHTIITCEELVPTSYFRENPNRTTIPWIAVDAVIPVKYGSYPGNMPGCYFSDERHLHQWLEAEKDPEAFGKFLDHYIYSSGSFEEYLEKCGGKKRIRELANEEHLAPK